MKPLIRGDVLTFSIRRRHGLCQIVRASKMSKGRTQYGFVVFDAFFTRRPSIDDVEGKRIYVARTPPKNMPFYFSIGDEPPAAFRRLGHRPLELAFTLPTSFRRSPRVRADACPVPAGWGFVLSRLSNDFINRGVPSEPYTSKHFPDWTGVEPRVLVKIDALVEALSKKKATLKATVRAFNRLEEHIDAPDALLKKLCALTSETKPAVVINALRTW